MKGLAVRLDGGAVVYRPPRRGGESHMLVGCVLDSGDRSPR